MRRPIENHRLSRRTFTAAAASGLGFAPFLRMPVSGAQFSWKFGGSLGTDHPTTVRLGEAFEKIRIETNGQLEIKSYVNSILGGDTEMLRQVRLGAIEMQVAGGGTINTVVPTAMIESTAYAFKDADLAHAAMDGDLGKSIRADFPARGFYGFDKVFEYGFRNFTTSNRPIRRADDVQGLKLRVSPGKLYFDTLKSLGATPTTLNLNEIYTSLQTHIVDGQETPMWAIYDTKIYEVQKYCSLSRHMWSALYILLNKEKWDALPRSVQDVANKHFTTAVMLERQDSVAMEKTLRMKMESTGLVFNDVDTESLKAKLKSGGYYERWRAEYGATAWTALERYSGKLT